MTDHCKQMTPTEYLSLVAEIETQEIVPGKLSQVYVSKFDRSYITHVGLESNIQFLADREITEQLTHGVGFSPKDNKWYGWSHRAIFGFAPGSTCKRGDCHYRAADPNDFLQDVIRFWTDEEDLVYTTGKHCVRDGVPGVCIEWQYNDATPNKKLHGKISGTFQPYPDTWGKGEWTAVTMEDAKQMAIDFNESVS